MTNKRKHALERMVRLEFNSFDTTYYNYIYSFRLLEQITRLMFDRVKLLRITKHITTTDARFMSYCVRKYYFYYFQRQQYFFRKFS